MDYGQESRARNYWARGGGNAGDQTRGSGAFGDLEEMPGRQLGGHRRIRRRVMRQNALLSQLGYESVPEIFRRLQRQAQSDWDPNRQAAYLAPGMEAIDKGYQAAGAAATRGLADRGLTDSSFAAATQAGLAGEMGRSRAQLVASMTQQQEAERQQAQRQLQEMALNLAMGAGREASNNSQYEDNLKLQQAQIEAQQGGMFDQLLGGIGGLAGMAIGGGWNPFRRPRRTIVGAPAD